MPDGEPEAPRLVLERWYPAAPERVWEAFTRDDVVQRWYCPNPALPTTARLDAQPGGAHEVDMGQGFALRGTYSVVDSGERLAHTWAFNGGHETHVEVRLHPDDLGGTRVVLTHDGFEDAEERDGIEQGWTITLGRLGEVLGDPG